MKATPPYARSRAALGLTAAAAVGRFELQVCRACAAVQYPPREACHRCLSSLLDWRLQSGGGELLAETTLLHSHDEFFRGRLPIRLGLVRLDSGPTAVVYLHSSVGDAPARVTVDVRLDRAGQGVLVGFAEGPMAETKQRPEDRLLHEMTCDPRGRRVWVAAGGTELGKALVQCLTEAGAEVADSQLDIVVNNVDVMGSAREQMEAHYFGLLRLSEQLTPRVAWVNILSIYALMSLPGLQGFAASMAAALSLSQSLRAEMQGRGVRVINVFPGPMETERYRAVALPKLHPVALARAVTRALQDSVEDVYPGDVAQEWLARWRESPKALEREIAQ